MHAVARSMDEVGPVAPFGDDATGDRVDVLARSADGRGGDRGLLCFVARVYASRNSLGDRYCLVRY